MPRKPSLVRADTLAKIVEAARTNTHVGGRLAVEAAVNSIHGFRKDEKFADPQWDAYVQAALREYNKPPEVQQEITAVQKARPKELAPGRLPDGYVPKSKYDEEVARRQMARYDKDDEEREKEEERRRLTRELPQPEYRSKRKKPVNTSQTDLPFGAQGRNNR